MPKYRRNFNKKQSSKFYTNKSGISTPQLPEAKTTSSVFPDAVKRSATSTTNFTTPWQQYRSFDAELNKIDVNIAGYAALYGKPSHTTSMNLGNDYGLFTGSFNDIYNDNRFSLLALINRDISINYWGMDYTPLSDEAAGTAKLTDHSFMTWESNMTTLLSLLDQSMYTDLRFLQWAFQTTQTTGSTVFTSNYKYVHSAQSYMLLAYQLQLASVLITLLNFEMLTAQLPLLQELFKDKSMFIIAIQDELKRSQYTARVKRLMTWLKSRFVDVNFFKSFILPTAVVSKETDGMNSPIIYLTHTINIPLEGITYINPNATGASAIDTTSTTLPVKFFTQDLTITRDASNAITNITGGNVANGILPIRCNSFNISTIMDILLDTTSKTDFTVRLESWLSTARTVLDSMLSQALDISSSQWFRDTEAALQKIASQPSGINWQQNIDPSVIFMTEYSNYELVNALATFMPSPIVDNNNGYSMYLPLFRRTGFRETMIKEHSQAFYLPSNDTYMSFIKLGDRISFTTRQNKRLSGLIQKDPKVSTYTSVLTLQEVELEFDESGNPDYNYVAVSLTDTASQAYLVLQDNFTIVRDSVANPMTWTNSELITFVNAIFQNRWADYQKLATQNFIIPLA